MDAPAGHARLVVRYATAACLSALPVGFAAWLTVANLRSRGLGGHGPDWGVWWIVALPPVALLAAAAAAGVHAGRLAVYLQRLIVVLGALVLGLVVLFLLLTPASGPYAALAAMVLVVTGGYTAVVLLAAFVLAGAQRESLWPWDRYWPPRH